MDTRRKTVFSLLVIIAAGAIALPFSVQGQSREEIEREIARLEAEKRRTVEQRQAAAQESRPTGRTLEEIVDRYEKLLEGCAVRRSDRCAEVMFTLGSLYYDLGRDSFVRAREQYEKDMNQWERRPVGPEPVDPRPNYSKATDMYKRLIEEYPAFGRVSEAYYQIGNINLIGGSIDDAREWFLKLVERFPNDPRASAANFRLGDFAYLEHNNVEALEFLSRVKQNEIDIQTWEMVHYRKAEVHYNIGDFDKAVELFHSYVEMCDAGRYQRQEFRGMALEFLAISFSDMADGAREALRYFRRVGDRPYIAQVIYMIGEKNYTHGQFDDAIVALNLALDRFPMYSQAPIARQYLIESYVIKREPEEANKHRESLVDDYGPGSQWYSRNSGEKVVIDKARDAMVNALGNLAIYYHSLAQSRRERSFYENAMQRYHEFFDRFPEEKWKVYEYKYNVAEIHSQLGNYAKAAEFYDFVAMADLSTYPEYRTTIDTLGMDPEERERRRAQIDEAKSPVEISQEDAAYNAIVALDNNRKRVMAAQDLNDEQVYPLPATRDLISYVDRFVNRFPQSDQAANVLFLAGNIHYEAKAYNEAISTFSRIAENYSDAEIASRALRMLGNSYSFNRQYDNALEMYDRLLAREQGGTGEYEEIVDLAAASIYRNAETLSQRREFVEAAAVFMSIYSKYPSSKVADRGWYEAGVSYEEAVNFSRAAEVFFQMGTHFPQSSLLKDAFIRSAKNYERADMYEDAARIYVAGAQQINEPDYSIPALSSASEAYEHLGKYDLSGNMYKKVFEWFPDNEQTPQALYNAGLLYERGEHYQMAIDIYNLVIERYPQSEFASEGAFSIGLSYMEMGEKAKMAEAFAKFARTYTHDRYQQVEALTRAGDAFFDLERFDDAKENYLLATKVYQEYSATADMDVESVARSYYRIGELYYREFMSVELVASNEREMQRKITAKTEALAVPAQYFARAIELGVQEWTMRSTHMIGMGFVDMAEAVADQTLFGSKDQQVAGRIQVLSSLEPYYIRAQDYFFQNIEWAKDQNIMGEYIVESMDRAMEMAYRQGQILEEVGLTFLNAPIPDGLDDDERAFYQEELEMRNLHAQDAAVPKYEEGLMIAAEIGIAQSPWVDKMRDRIDYIHPGSEALDIEIVQWVPEVDSAAAALAAETWRDEEYNRTMRRIERILQMEIPVEEKVRQLSRIETETRRNIVQEQEKIAALRNN